ncbi:MAG: septum formation inhibitor Maf [Clostridia bacterium]|nr:septum formation inhibitor Maf [Clostridia bacterium]
MNRFILASASPRRKEIVESAGYAFEIIVSDVDENITEELSPEKTVEELAKRKAMAVLRDNEDAVVFGCDTVVAVDGKILGKPADDEDAFNMLSMLSGKTHTVSTGVCICSKDKTEVFSNTTEVEFYQLSEKTIRSYIASKECSDKAGSYGIQGFGRVLVKEIKGDYFSVMGLPVAESARVLAGFGIYGKVKL